jgi:hypothetical protein
MGNSSRILGLATAQVPQRVVVGHRSPRERRLELRLPLKAGLAPLVDATAMSYARTAHYAMLPASRSTPCQALLPRFALLHFVIGLLLQLQQNATLGSDFACQD